MVDSRCHDNKICKIFATERHACAKKRFCSNILQQLPFSTLFGVDRSLCEQHSVTKSKTASISFEQLFLGMLQSVFSDFS